MAVKEQGSTEAEKGPRPLGVAEVVELLVGRVSPRLDYATIPLTSWPCLLVAAVAEVSERTEEANYCSWQNSVGSNEAMLRNELTVRVSGDYPLPNAFDADVFAVLVAKAVAANRAASNGGRSGGDFMLNDVLADLRLDTSDPHGYQRVSESIVRLCGVSVVSSSHVERPGRKTRDYEAPSNVTMFGVLTSYNMPADGDFDHSPVRVLWNDAVYAAITAAPTPRGAGNASEVFP